MSEEIPIDIIITANVTGIKEVQELTQELQKMQNIVGGVSESLDKASTKSDAMSDAARRFKSVVEGVIGAEGGLVRRVDALIKKQEEEEQELSKNAQAYLTIKGVGDVWAQTLDELNEKVRKHGMVVSMQKNLLKGLSDKTLEGSQAIRGFSKAMGIGVDDAKLLVSAHQGLHKTFMTSREGLDAITGQLDKMSAAGKTGTEAWKLIGKEITLAARQIGWTNNQIMDLKRALNRSIVEGKEQAETNYRVRESIKGIYEMNRMYMASLGATGVAVREFTRSIFWTGLGMMFTSMSIARMLRRGEQLRDLSYSLATSSLRVKDAQEEYNEALRWSGPASEEATNASRALVDAQIRHRMAMDSARASTEQYYLSWMMLIMGTFPTLMRTGSDILTYFMKYNIATQMGAASTAQLGGTQITLAGTAVVATGATTGLGLSFSWAAVQAAILHVAIAGAIGAATMGIGMLVSLGIASAMTAGKMEELEREMAEMEDRLTGHSLVSDLEQGVLATKELRMAMAKAGTELPDKLSTDITAGVREPIVLGRRDRDVTVIINNPVVRKDKDIRDISRQVKRVITKGAYSRIGRY